MAISCMLMPFALAITQQLTPPLITDCLQSQQQTVYMPTVPESEMIAFFKPSASQKEVANGSKVTQKSNWLDNPSLGKIKTSLSLQSLIPEREITQEETLAFDSSMIDVMPGGHPRSFYA